MMWFWGSGYSWGMTLVGIVMMLIFWGGALALVLLVVRGIAGPQTGQHDAALDMLRRRLAAGEITPEEFERVRQLVG